MTKNTFNKIKTFACFCIECEECANFDQIIYFNSAERRIIDVVFVVVVVVVVVTEQMDACLHTIVF